MSSAGKRPVDSSLSRWERCAAGSDLFVPLEEYVAGCVIRVVASNRYDFPVKAHDLPPEWCPAKRNPHGDVRDYVNTTMSFSRMQSAPLARLPLQPFKFLTKISPCVVLAALRAQGC